MKIIFRRVLPALLALLLLLPVAACGKKNEGENVLTDQAGREVRLNGEAKRVVSCYYVTTYAMLSLGLSDRLVGIEKKAETRPIYAMAAPGLLSLPAVGSLKGIDAEAIAALEPDLILLPLRLAEQLPVLEALGLPVMVVDPETDASLTEMLTLIGTACGVGETAERLIRETDRIKQSGEETGERPSVLLCGNSSYLTAAPARMYQDELIAMAGGKNACAGYEGKTFVSLSYEAILALDPDYVVIPGGAGYTKADLTSDPALSALRAVREDRVLTMPGTFEEWDSPVPSGALGVLWLRTVLHPEETDAETFRKETAAFYETFYGFTPGEGVLASLF